MFALTLLHPSRGSSRLSFTFASWVCSWLLSSLWAAPLSLSYYFLPFRYAGLAPNRYCTRVPSFDGGTGITFHSFVQLSNSCSEPFSSIEARW
jgi:hypothetical protein